MLDTLKMGTVVVAVLMLAAVAANEAAGRRSEPVASVGDCPAVLMVAPDGDPGLLTRPNPPAC